MHSLEISEPWDFGSMHGTGSLTAQIADVDAGAILLKLQSLCRYRDTEFDHLMAMARHLGTPLDAAIAGGTVPVNLVPVLKQADATGWRKAAESWRAWHRVGTLRIV